MAGLECGKFDLSNLPQDEMIALDQTIWLKAQVEERIVIVDGRPHVVIIFANKVNAGLCENNKAVNKQIAHMTQTVLTDNSDGSGSGSGNGSSHQAQAISPAATGTTQQMENALGASDLNAMGYEPPPVIPAAAIIPMKSNVKTYGPYTSSNFSNSYGGTSIETNPELCPWVFGSLALMNSTGSALVESKALGLVKAENGSVTIPGLPVAGLSQLGAQIGGTGPNLSSMNFTFGSNGITTSYQFSTYTPKFGNLTNSQVDKIKSIAKNRQEQLKFLRTQAILQNKIGRQLQKVQNAANQGGKGNLNLPANNKNTVHRLLMGEIYPVTTSATTQNKTVVALGSLEKGSVEMVKEYNKKAYMSLDGIFGPVSLDGDGQLPRFTKYEPGCHKASPIQPQPPFSLYEEIEDNGLDQYNLEIDQEHTNPLTNDFSDGEHHHNGAGKGHVIDIVGREQEVPEDGLMTTLYSTEDAARHSADYRFLGLRGPLVLHAWGYDTDGKPIPNSSDTLAQTSGGIFSEENLTDKFLSNWLQHPSAWPVGPIDLRFDRKRGMWVTPQGYKIVVAKLKEDLPAYGSTTAKLINENTEQNQTYGADLWDENGNKVTATEEDSQAFIKVVDRIGVSFSKDDLVYAYYDTFNCEYIVLPNSKGNSVIKFALVQDKNLTNKEVSAILVDEYGYPVKKDGRTPVEDQNEFNDNIIQVRDPYLSNSDLPAPRGPGSIPGETSAFGPALGSNSLQEHVNGIVLTDGYEDNYKTIGPFIGYALKRENQSSTTYIPGEGEVTTESGVVYDIITLESFAKYVTGKIGTVNSSYGASTEGAGDGYYLGARIAHRQGVVPVGRGHGGLPSNLNVILRSNLNQFDGTHGYIIGDIIDAPVGNGDIINDVDGCRFVAILDNEVSTTTYLVYDIIECETSALTCSYYIKDQNFANEVNKEFGDFSNENFIEASFIHGFMWDIDLSSTNYLATTLSNGGVDKNDLNTGEIIVGCRGMALLTGIEDGVLGYTIVTKSEIANVAQRYLNVENPGLYGCPDFDSSQPDDRKINNSDDFWDGLQPTEIPENYKPKITMSDDQQWMTYDNGIITASWDEYGNRLAGFMGEVENCKYKIIYAQEAPVIMTCIAASDFTPEDVGGVNLAFALANILPSCQGADREPITTILQGNVFNPMGCGALVGDLVTIQRVFVGSNMAGAGHPACNYKYIVIQTGKLVQ